MKEREETLAQLQKDLAAAQEKHQQTLTRFDRALKTLERRGHQKDEILRAALQAVQEEWAKKTADRDAEIAALQSNILAQESERQAELDRLAKQFAEERFQLEKTKEELEWKLKDRKEVSERQLASRQKEIQALENEIQKARVQREEELSRKTAAFETDKEKLQASLAALQRQIEDTRQTQEAALAAKEQDLQTLLKRSKDRLRILGEEFNQKVGLWRSTNDSLRTQIEQLKGHAAQAQDSWEAMRKEKENEVNGLRQELSQWETRIKSDAEEFERTYSQDRQALTGQIRKQEKELQETIADFERRLANQEDEAARMAEEIQSREAGTEGQWHATLEQWQMEKQSLQQQKVHLEQEFSDMQGRFQTELRQTEEAANKLRMDIAFKEAQLTSQEERQGAQMTRELAPLRERLARLLSAEESERNGWEIRLRAKEDELKILKTRLAQREMRLQEESRRRTQEIEKLRKQLSEEVAAAQARYDSERTQLEKLLLEHRESLSRLQARENETPSDGTEREHPGRSGASEGTPAAGKPDEPGDCPARAPARAL